MLGPTYLATGVNFDLSTNTIIFVYFAYFGIETWSFETSPK